MNGLSENHFQNWRAVAVSAREEHLLYMDQSYSRVRNGYTQAFVELLTLDEQQSIKKINIQRWQGTADCGCWVTRGDLPIPAPVAEVAQAS
jgi:hypothetical protein